ncbi:MAG: cytochrome c biogenesis heme-transporting ATPase CcmA [Burkholderiales bacterium]
MLEASNLECRRGARTLFGGLALQLRRGELLRVAGENGSGKTTLLKILAGLLLPDAGEVRWGGAPIQALREEYARQIAFVGHAPALKDELSAAENLTAACAIAGAPASAGAVRDALSRFSLAADRVPVRRLSQGQRRRVALARLMLSPAALWLLDEPFGALDAAAARVAAELIGRHVSAGGAVAYSTHQEADIPGTVQRVLALA